MVVSEVREAGVWMERGGVGCRKVRSEGVGARIGAWVLSCRIRIRVTEHRLLVLVGAHVLLGLAWLPLIEGEIGNALGTPGVGLASW